MKPRDYRDMQLLQEVAKNPHATQRDLARQMRVALGLTNLMLRRLETQGYIKIVVAERNRIQYQITPQGLHEKSRLTLEHLEYSLQHYREIRRFLREQLSELENQGHRKILLYGTVELAEIVYLTVQEMGLEFVGLIGDRPGDGTFLNQIPIRDLSQVTTLPFDRVVVLTCRQPLEQVIQRLGSFGVPKEKMIFMPEDLLSFQQSRLTPETTDVVILCGGRGTRLGPLTADTPKPLLPVAGRPFLLHLLLQFRQEGFTRFILAARYLPGRFRAFVSSCRDQIPAGIELVIEPKPLGTGGALRQAVQSVRSSTFIAVNGDSWVSQPLIPVLAHHEQTQRIFTVVAVEAAQVEGGALKKGVWNVGSHGECVGFATQDSVSEGWVNAGVYVLSRDLVASWPTGCYSLEGNLFSLLNGKQAGVFCSKGRLLDIGTPETYEWANRAMGSSEALLTLMDGIGVHGN